MDRSFWKGKKVLVTGHTGFKGAWLCLWLQQLSAQVTGYALEPPSEPSLFELADVASSVQSIHGDVRDIEHLERVFEQVHPEIVFHLAAQSLVRVSYALPVETYATNVMGTVNVLDVLRRIEGVRAGVIITSDKCYENRGVREGYREDDPMGGANPYSSSKGCAELVVSGYRRSYFSSPEGQAPSLGLASTRAGNVIGGGDWAANRLIPDCMRSVMEGRAIEVRNPDAVRPWQHVLEPLGGYLLLAERLSGDPAGYWGGWNFGPDDDDAKTVGEVVDRVVELWGEGAQWKAVSDQRFHEDRYLRLDCSKVHERLGWSPRTDLDLALRWVVEWYKQLQSNRDPRELCLNQIDRFMSMTPR